MKTEMHLHGMDDVLELLRSLPPEIVARRGGPVRAALRKAAGVIHRQALANLRANTAATSDGARRTSIGHLEKQVVVTRGKEPFGGRGERYLVRVRRKAYPNRSDVSTLKTAQLLEYGSSQQPAEPWLRPAVVARGQEAINAATRELVAAVERAARKHLKATRGKGR